MRPAGVVGVGRRARQRAQGTRQGRGRRRLGLRCSLLRRLGGRFGRRRQRARVRRVVRVQPRPAGGRASLADGAIAARMCKHGSGPRRHPAAAISATMHRRRSSGRQQRPVRVSLPRGSRRWSVNVAKRGDSIGRLGAARRDAAADAGKRGRGRRGRCAGALRGARGAAPTACGEQGAHNVLQRHAALARPRPNAWLAVPVACGSDSQGVRSGERGETSLRHVSKATDDNNVACCAVRAETSTRAAARPVIDGRAACWWQGLHRLLTPIAPALSPPGCASPATR